MKKIKCIIIVITLPLYSLAQNLEKVGSDDMLKINGGFNYNSTFYHADGIAPRRDPFAWYFSGNINFSILDWSIPFSYSYSNLHGTFSQPFNQYCVSPQYKWIKTYAGYTSMNFSSYTLAGHTFLGGGAELTPKNWKINLMAGRLKKAVEYDLINNSDANMCYRRIGYGAKISYEKSGHALGIIFFQAKDDPTSLLFIPSTTLIRPMENTAMSLTAKTKISKYFFAEGEYALSGLTRNSLADAQLKGEEQNYFPGVFKMRTTSQFFHAMKGSVGYQQTHYKINLNYERVDPDYQTLGAYYFTNDMENITIAPAVNLFKNKLTIAANTGLQRNNLDKTKLGTTKRWAGSININFVPNQKFIFSGSYSNFTCYTRMRPQNDPYFHNTLDTLNFYQLSQNANLTANFNFGPSTNAQGKQKKLKQSIVLTGTYQVTGEKRGEQVSIISLYGGSTMVTIPSIVYNGNLGYNTTWLPTKTSLLFSFNMNESLLGSVTTLFIGPNLGLSQSLLKNKMRVSLGTSYNQVLTNGVVNSSVMNNRLSFNFTPKMKNEKFGKPSFGVNCAYLSRFSTIVTANSYSELTVMANINYGF